MPTYQHAHCRYKGNKLEEAEENEEEAGNHVVGCDRKETLQLRSAAIPVWQFFAVVGLACWSLLRSQGELQVVFALMSLEGAVGRGAGTVLRASKVSELSMAR